MDSQSRLYSCYPLCTYFILCFMKINDVILDVILFTCFNSLGERWKLYPKAIPINQRHKWIQTRLNEFFFVCWELLLYHFSLIYYSQLSSFLSHPLFPFPILFLSFNSFFISNLYLGVFSRDQFLVLSKYYVCFFFFLIITINHS